MAPRRRYTKQEKVAAVVQATLTNATAAAQSSGIPETNIRRWETDPELAEYGAKTREEIGDGARVIAALAVDAIITAIRAGQFEPRDLIVAFGTAVDKSQLLAGHATERTETRDLSFNDHEAEVLGEVVRSELARRADERTAVDALERPGTPGAETPAG
jgi:hypothetical protein